MTLFDHARVAAFLALVSGFVLGVTLGEVLAHHRSTPDPLTCHGTIAIETRPGGLIARCEGAP